VKPYVVGPEWLQETAPPIRPLLLYRGTWRFCRACRRLHHQPRGSLGYPAGEEPHLRPRRTSTAAAVSYPWPRQQVLRSFRWGVCDRRPAGGPHSHQGASVRWTYQGFRASSLVRDPIRFQMSYA